MSEYGEGDYCPVYRSETRTARQEHVCDACNERICRGHSYHYTAVLFDGRWEITKRCARCQTIFEHLRKRIDAEGDEEEYCNDRLACGHEYKNRWGEEPPPEIAALAFALPGEIKL